MKNYFLILVGVVALVVLAVVFSGGMGESVPADLEEFPVVIGDEELLVEETETAVVVKLSAQNKSGESGTATFTDADGKTRVVLKLTGAPAGVSQPAHIHLGACPNPGAVKYPLSYPVDGASETLLDVSLATLQSELPLAVNVHKNSEEAKVYVSCGDIRL